MSTLKSICAKDISKEERKLALSSQIFLKQKRYGDIKGRSCADGQPQMHIMNIEITTSSTVATESVFITSTIDEFKGIKVAPMYVPSDFMHTPMEPKYPKVHITFLGKLIDLIVKVDTNIYRKFVGTDSKGSMILYVEM